MPTRLISVQIPWASFGSNYTAVHANCCICGTPAYRPLASLVINQTEFFLVTCSNCGLLWRNPMPDYTFLSSLYTDDYYRVANVDSSLLAQVGIPDDTNDDKEMRRGMAKLEIERWKRYTLEPVLGKNKMLELGGGRGYLQHAASAAGWDTTGVEISPSGIKEAIQKGLLVLPVTLEDMCKLYIPAPAYYDVIAFYDFLEHVTDPAKILRLIKYMLKDTGRIILRVPCSGFTRLHLVDHIYHFTEVTIKLLLAKEGFTVESIFDSGTFISPDGGFIQNKTIICKKEEQPT